MADNVAITAGTGTTVAADEVTDGTLGSCKVQFVKLMDGTLDGTSKAAVGANGLAADVKASVLPTGAATAAKQPALGTAGVSSTDVISVQGIASGTALPISGSVTVSSAPSTAVTNAGTFAVQATLAAGAAAIAKAEDVASADADVGVPAMAVRKATPANTSGTDGDYEMLQMSAGRLWASAVIEATENIIGKTVGIITNPSSSTQRPATTPTFASGQLVANSATAGSVVPLSWTTAARLAAGNFYIRRLRFRKSSTTITNASFRVHFYTASPTFTNGETAAWLTTQSGYLGSIDVTMTQAFSDGAEGLGAPNAGSELNVALASGQTIYACIEARGAYVGVASETFTAELEIWQN